MTHHTAECFEVTLEADRLTFRYRWSAVAGAVLLLGLAAAYFGFPLVASLCNGEVDLNYLAGYLSLMLLPIGMVAGVCYVLGRWRVPQVLDRTGGIFRRGRRAVCRLEQIASVIIAEVEVEDGVTYEVYFGLTDGRRLKLNETIRAMTDKEGAERFAQLLAGFLGVEVLVNYLQRVLEKK